MDVFGYTSVFFGRVQYINDKNDYGWEMKQLSEYAAKGNQIILCFLLFILLLFYYFCKISYFRITSMTQEDSIHGMIKTYSDDHDSYFGVEGIFLGFMSMEFHTNGKSPYFMSRSDL